MKIETKFKIGDEVWYSLKGNVYHKIVDHIRIDVGKNGKAHIYYSSELTFPLKEDRLFPNKEELLKSL